MSEAKTVNFMELERALAKLQATVHNALVTIDSARRAAYSAATLYLQAIGSHQGEFLDWIKKTQGVQGSDCIDQWVAIQFAPVKQLGIIPWELITAVQDGLSLKQWLATGTTITVGGKQRALLAKTKSAEALLPSEPPPEATPEEKVAQWRSRAIALEVALRQERSRNRELSHEVAALRREHLALVRLTKKSEITLS